MLCCRGALRCGAGLVTLAAPASVSAVLETALPEVIVRPLPDCSSQLIPSGISDLCHELERSDVVAIGPGLGRGDLVTGAVEEVIARVSGPLILDADALFALAARPALWFGLRGRAVVTPHAGEYARLGGRHGREGVASFAAGHDVVLALKGRPTWIAIPQGGVYLNPTGNTGLATGGSGDVLTGMMAGFVAGGASLEAAALISPYIHGLAAERYARDRSERSMIPSDLLREIPRTLKELEAWSG